MNPEDCIFFLLAKASQAGTRFWAHCVSELNVTAVQGMVINFLCEHDEVTSSELGKRTMLDSATLTGILDRLETAGFIERRQHPADRRAIHVCLTEDGRSTAQKLRGIAERSNKKFLKGLNLEEQKRLKSLLKAITPQV